MKNALANITFLLFVTICFTGCSISPTKDIAHVDTKRKIAVFFDGTANDETSNTNIKRLHSLVSLQSRDDIATIYIEGVGANNKVVGMATGWGIGRRVEFAYEFVIDQYRPGDEVYIFGFSRGAYSARILASLLYHAGAPIANSGGSRDLAGAVYDAFKGDMANRTARLKTLYEARGLPMPVPIRVKAMGLWDTVEALGWPDYKQDIDVPNDRYGDQLCNVDAAFHALSLDDDRARIFTPILLTRLHLLDDCRELTSVLSTDAAKAQYLDKIVDEVWFSGAHADVGGGYADSQLSGASLNWMIRKLAAFDLLPVSAGVQEDAFGVSHDPEHGFPWAIFYRKQHRDIWNYATGGGAIYNGKRLKLHASAIKRLTECRDNKCGHREHEYPWETMWGGCRFERSADGYSPIDNLERCAIVEVK